jgi:hypothetical protein
LADLAVFNTLLFQKKYDKESAKAIAPGINNTSPSGKILDIWAFQPAGEQRLRMDSPETVFSTVKKRLK